MKIGQNIKYKRVSMFLLATALTILVLAPFQGLILMWLTSVFGHQIIWQVWKELLLILLAIFTAFYVYKDRDLCLVIKKDKLFWAIGLYSALHLLLVATRASDFRSAVAGTMLNLRFLVFFTIAFVLGFILRARILHRIPKLIMYVGFTVAIFAVLQMTILPGDILSHVGYNGKPIPAQFTIDSDMSSIRVASTTRGPNNLGAYLLVPLLFFSFHFMRVTKLWFKDRNSSSLKKMVLPGLCMLVGAIALYGTHSRSAWLGFFVALLLMAFLSLKPKYRSTLAISATIILSIIVVLGFALKDTNYFQTVILHDVPDKGGVSTSNEGHIGAMVAGLKNIRDEKFVGCGPGCAGPASLHNPKGSQIAENYFIQITQETGIAGLALFIWITYITTSRLFSYKTKDSLAIVLVCSFAGVTVISLFLHTWADDSISYVWWGMTGLLIGAYSHLGSKTANAKRLHTSD